MWSAQPRPTRTVSPTKPDRNMTNLRCTTDHHAVPPLNIRPVESGIIPDHFEPVEKLIPLTTTSQRPDQPPLYFRPTYALPDQGPLIADPSKFSRVGESGGWSGERALKARSHKRPDQPPLSPALEK